MAETQASQSAPVNAGLSDADTGTLSDIASGGAMLNQVISEVTKAVSSLGDITLPASSGGTGIDTYTVGDILYANTTATLAALPDVATGNALLSGGIGAAPAYGKVDLTATVSGTLPVTNGGSGRASHTAYAVVCGGTTTTAAQQSVASVGTAGQPLLSAGAGALPAFGAMTVTEDHAWFFSSVTNQDYKVYVNCSYAWTAVEMTTICTSGTCTMAAKKNGVAITGLSNSVSTSEVTNTASSGNVFAIGDDLTLTVSSNSAAINISVKIKFTRSMP